MVFQEQNKTVCYDSGVERKGTLLFWNDPLVHCFLFFLLLLLLLIRALPSFFCYLECHGVFFFFFLLVIALLTDGLVLGSL